MALVGALMYSVTSARGGGGGGGGTTMLKAG